MRIPLLTTIGSAANLSAARRTTAIDTSLFTKNCSAPTLSSSKTNYRKIAKQSRENAQSAMKSWMHVDTTIGRWAISSTYCAANPGCRYVASALFLIPRRMHTHSNCTPSWLQIMISLSGTGFPLGLKGTAGEVFIPCAVCRAYACC